MGSCSAPCLVQGSVGAVYPVRPLLSLRYKVTPGGTTVAAASCPALASTPAVTIAAPSPQEPGCSGGEGAYLHSSGRPVAGVSLVSWALLASACPGGALDLGLCPPAPWAVGPMLLESHSRGCAACSGQSRRPSSRQSCSLGPGRHTLQPFMELGSRGVACSLRGCISFVSAPGSLRASPLFLGSCGPPCQRLSIREDW